ncbi:CLUMA_CG012968, isoform A [Clunio marinus]|uniref:CLUMA_CG012968, isoform A n=1 Tax=Clunio marinus TaxID=568069 RepID=A0A1J1IHU9_9DIPT|nr:CLUMA_CG012968, isoform A [Clunio marinus]
MDVASGQQVVSKMSPSQIEMFSDHKQVKQIDGGQTKLPMKRSFDVAFLMLPDDKSKRREKANNSPELNVESFPMTELSVRSDLMTRYHNLKSMNNNKVFISSDYVNKVNDDRFSSGSLNSTASSEKSDEIIENDLPRSAFSKVPQINNNLDSPVPPPLSPDQLSCSSASPPISYSPPSGNFRPDYSQFMNSNAFQAINQSGFSHGKYKNLIYRGCQIPSAHLNHSNNNDHSHLTSFQFGGSNHHAAAFMSQPEQFIRNPAAAILSTLLPTTLGALSLPAQNVCAKCNISFRMTSDLVYHMRSHHKNENVHDPNRRKREEKLKCPVCSESFRERHHLTRHMTAHQDKEGDLLEHEIAEFHSRRK